MSKKTDDSSTSSSNMSRLECKVQEISAEVEKLGHNLKSAMSLQSKDLPNSEQISNTQGGTKQMKNGFDVENHDPSSSKNSKQSDPPLIKPNASPNSFQRPEMSAEEKRAQREAKKNEKKQKKESASDKKDTSIQPKSSVKDKNEKIEKKQSEKEKMPKSSIRNGKSGQEAKEVKFDMSANTVKESESLDDIDVINTACSAPPIADASALVGIHHRFLTLATRCEQDLVSDLDTLCIEFIDAFKDFVSDWGAKREKDESLDPNSIGMDLNNDIKPQIGHLTRDGRWPLPLALGNIVRQLKKEMLNIAPHKQTKTVKDIDLWFKTARDDNFEYAYQAITQNLEKKLISHKNVMTYDWCPVVNYVILNSECKNLVCTVVDQEINMKGIRHVEEFLKKGIKCRYTDLQSVGSAIRECSMVLLGCSAVLSNGSVAVSRGAVLVALAAKAFNVPVLVAAQCFKFVDRVQSYGRMALLGRERIELLPADLITAIVTDIRILPPSSAPAVLRAKALDS